MAQKCKACHHTEIEEINRLLVSGTPLEAISKRYGITTTSLHRHRQHIPKQLVKAQEAQEVAQADTLLGRIAALDSKAETVYTKAMSASNLNAAIGAVRELRGITELYAKLAGEIDQNSINIYMMPEWASVRTKILTALEPYPEALQAVVKALGGDRT